MKENIFQWETGKIKYNSLVNQTEIYFDITYNISCKPELKASWNLAPHGQDFAKLSRKCTFSSQYTVFSW